MRIVILAAVLFTGCAAAPVKRDFHNYSKHEKIALAIECMDNPNCELPQGARMFRR